MQTSILLTRQLSEEVSPSFVMRDLADVIG